MIKVIAFDFGGVIYTYNHKKLMKDVATELKQPVNAVTEAWKIKINDYELGKISEDEFWSVFLERLNISYDNKKLHKIVITHFKPIEASLEILTKLKNQKVTGLISNQTSWIDELEKNINLKNYLMF